ncbi:MAG: hypothetical protein ACPL1Y_03065 [Thermoplasmata archaeon]
MYGYYRYRRGISFSSRELKDIMISVLVLTTCFTLARIWGAWNALDIQVAIQLFMISFFAVLTAFLLHELAHKFTANYYGYWAEYRASYFFLLIAFACSLFLGFVFAAPGAVVIAGYLSRRENGIISAAGPFTNLMIAVILLPATFLLPLTGFLNATVGTVIYVNLFIAGFNMIPFGNIDGAKVLAWKWWVWLLMVIAICATFVAFIHPPLV